MQVVDNSIIKNREYLRKLGLGKGKLVVIIEKKLTGPEEYPFTPRVKLKCHRRNGIIEVAQVYKESTARNIIRFCFY